MEMEGRTKEHLRCRNGNARHPQPANGSLWKECRGMPMTRRTLPTNRRHFQMVGGGFAYIKTGSPHNSVRTSAVPVFSFLFFYFCVFCVQKFDGGRASRGVFMTSLVRRRSSSEARTTFGLGLELLLLLAAQMLHMNTNTTTDCWSICFSDIDLAPRRRESTSWDRATATLLFNSSFSSSLEIE